MRPSCWFLPKNIAELEGDTELPPEKQAAGRSPAASRAGGFFTAVVNLDQSRSRFDGMLLSWGDQQRTFDDDRQDNSLRVDSCVTCRHRILHSAGDRPKSTNTATARQYVVESFSAVVHERCGRIRCGASAGCRQLVAQRLSSRFQRWHKQRGL